MKFKITKAHTKNACALAVVLVAQKVKPAVVVIKVKMPVPAFSLGEGGQTPLYMRLPKRGFNNVNRRNVEPVNVAAIERAIAEKKLDAAKINRETLAKAGVVRGKALIKILATGEVKSKLVIDADLASAAAIAAIEKAGGKINLPKVEKEAA